LVEGRKSKAEGWLGSGIRHPPFSSPKNGTKHQAPRTKYQYQIRIPHSEMEMPGSMEVSPWARLTLLQPVEQPVAVEGSGAILAAVEGGILPPGICQGKRRPPGAARTPPPGWKPGSTVGWKPAATPAGDPACTKLRCVLSPHPGQKGIACGWTGGINAGVL
jgi:hypothetical protein